MARMDPELYAAATRGDVARLAQLVSTSSADILVHMTPQFNTAVHIAASHGHRGFVKEALKVNEELLVSRNNDSDTPLHLAARAGKLDVAEHLINLAQAQAWRWPKEDYIQVIMSPLLASQT